MWDWRYRGGNAQKRSWLRPRSNPSDVLITSGLIGHYDMVQGANVDTIYDLTGNYNASRLSGFAPSWANYGLTFAGIAVADFPAGLGNNTITDLCFMQINHNAGGYQSISTAINLFTDNRICHGSAGGWTWSPVDVRLGNTIVTTVCPVTPTPSKLYFEETEVVGYENQGRLNPAGQTWWGYTGFGVYAGVLYYRLCWDFALTPEQVASQSRWVAAQLAARSGGSVVPTSTASGPYILCYGDSITSGQPGAVGNDWPRKVRAGLTNPARVLNYSDSGTTVASLASTIGANAGLLKTKEPSTDVVVIIAKGTNDILVNNYSAATMIANLTSCVTNARNGGADYVIVRTIPQANWTSGWTQVAGDAVLVDTNNAILNGDTGADEVIDLTSGPLGHGANTADAAYYFDGIHLVNGGHVVIANTAISTLNGMGYT